MYICMYAYNTIITRNYDKTHSIRTTHHIVRCLRFQQLEIFIQHIVVALYLTTVVSLIALFLPFCTVAVNITSPYTVQLPCL